MHGPYAQFHYPQAPAEGSTSEIARPPRAAPPALNTAAVSQSGLTTPQANITSPPATPASCGAPTSECSDQETVHYLGCSWSFWKDESGKKGMTAKEYEESIKLIAEIKTIQEFWTVWNNFGVETLTDGQNIRLFRTGIKPTWEDEQNRRGGRWVSKTMERCKRDMLWLAVVINMIGELLEDGCDGCVNGVVLSAKDSGDIVQVWSQNSVKNAAATEGASTIGDLLRQIYDNEPGVSFSYIPHARSGRASPNSATSPLSPFSAGSSRQFVTTPTSAAA